MGIVVALTAIGRTISPLWRKFQWLIKNVIESITFQWMQLMKE